MSASLVGSEMCIRDRKFPERPAFASALGGWAIRQACVCGRYRVTQFLHCLLYTSDAADDM
eukprot:930845-Alexandrium_andersonii.AAC.1